MANAGPAHVDDQIPIIPDQEARFIEGITTAMERCDETALLVLRKEVLVALNKSLGLSYSNRNKEELVRQLLEFKGCWCKTRSAINTACTYIPQALLYAALAYGGYLADKYAAQTIGPYAIGSPIEDLSHGSFIRDNVDVYNRISKCLGREGLDSNVCITGVAAGMVGEVLTKKVGRIFGY
jgi:hypothetical protein